MRSREVFIRWDDCTKAFHVDLASTGREPGYLPAKRDRNSKLEVYSREELKRLRATISLVLGDTFTDLDGNTCYPVE